MKKDFLLPLGGGNEIGASCYLLRIDGTNILIDAGIRLQTEKIFPDFHLLNDYIGGFKELDAFFLTHAHLDHCGAITKLHYEAPLVPKYASRATITLARIMLQDALAVSSRRSEDWSIHDPTEELLDGALASYQPVAFQRPFCLEHSGVRVYPVKAGHILGATSYLFEANQKRILVTGDLSLHDQRTVAGFDLDIVAGVDVLVIESTYAYQPDYQSETHEEQQFALVQKISEVVQQGGRVLIPSFALGRAQEIACLLGEFFEQGLVNPFPVLLDGLVKPVCEAYHEMRELLQGRLRTRADHSIYTSDVRPTPLGYSPTPEKIQQMEPGCVICSSGMLLDHTRSAMYAEQFLKNPKDAVFFSGYLDDESPGKRLLALKDRPATFMINRHQVIPISRIDRYHLSAHAPGLDLQKIIWSIKPKKIIFVHGNYRYTGDPKFLQFLLQLEASGIHVDQAANGVPIYL